MNFAFFLICAALLALERLVYLWAWQSPAGFSRTIAAWPTILPSDPVLALRRMFIGFKLIQVGVLLAWCSWFGSGWPVPTAPLGVFAIALSLFFAGQFLNFSVMCALGTEGVFYGNRFGRSVEWVSGFPFSLVPHPQYLGALVSVWAFMLAMRFPHLDWIVLPLLSTFYYALGARLER